MNQVIEGIKSNIRWIALGVIFAAALVPSLYFYNKYQEVNHILKASGQTKTEDAKDLEEQVGKHMSLPKESPSIARVSDKQALAGQDFFKLAENGDKVLIYKKAKLAVLFRPSTDKIINVAPIALDGEVAGESTPVARPGAATPSPKPLTAAVYNGSKTAGYARQVGDKVKTTNPNITLGKLSNSVGDYTEIIVIELTPNAKGAGAKIAKDLSGRVAAMPKAEATPDADLLIIAGK